ncbi:MAG: GNAT family N-acetyltransferase [Spirosomataceae bacterium]
MLNSLFIETEHLLAFPLDGEQLTLYLHKSPTFEETMGLQNSFIYISEEVEELFREAILPRIKKEPKNIHWFTNWIIIAKETQQVVGDFCFYDYPDAQGLVEFGYGIYPSQQNKGYMHEIMQGIIAWVKTQDGVQYIRARTDRGNIPSIRVLKKNGFVSPNETEEIQFWYYKMESFV